MSEDERFYSAISFVVGIIASSLTWIIVINNVNDMWREEIIQHGAAEYNPTTGAFQWKEVTP